MNGQTLKQMANIAISSARIARLFGMDPKVAFLSHSTFGQPTTERTLKVKVLLKF